MATRQIKGAWWVDFRSDYVRYRKRSPENSRAGARAYEALLRHRLARGEPLDAQHSEEQTFQQFADTWFNDYVLTNNRPSEQKTKRRALRTSLVPFFGKLRLDEIGKKNIELYKAREQRNGTGSRTINSRLTILRTCLGMAQDWGAMRNAPPVIKRLKCPPPKTDFLTPEEAESLLANAKGVMHEMILLALRTGLRQGEIRGLQWEAIDWENRLLTVRHTLCDLTKSLMPPKNNRERHVPIADDLYAVLRARRKCTGYVFTNRNGRPFPRPDHFQRLRCVQKAAGLRKTGWHALRHTFATHLAAKVSLRTVQELLGHSSITMTMRYAHVAPSTLREAIDLLGRRGQPAQILGQPMGSQSEDSTKNPAIAP